MHKINFVFLRGDKDKSCGKAKPLNFLLICVSFPIVAPQNIQTPDLLLSCYRDNDAISFAK